MSASDCFWKHLCRHSQGVRTRVSISMSGHSHSFARFRQTYESRFGTDKQKAAQPLGPGAPTFWRYLLAVAAGADAQC
jgi:hypothetical protein